VGKKVGKGRWGRSVIPSIFLRYFKDLQRNNGGGSGIRTRDTVSRIHTFQACAFNHSATPPA
jgi:hypothetical protein